MSDGRAVGILGVGTLLPPHVRGNEFWDGKIRRENPEEQKRRDFLAIERTVRGEVAKLPPEVALAMARHANDPYRGARTRHVIAEDAEVSDMEAEAARRAMRAAGVRPDEIGLVLVSSLLPDRINPSNAPAIVAKCEMLHATAWSLEVGCASFHPELATAAALIRAGTFRHAVIVCSIAPSRFLDYSTTASISFGDAAAAAVVGPVPDGYGLLGFWSRTDGSFRDSIVIAPVVDGEPQRRWEPVNGPARLTSFDTALGKQAGERAAEFCREASLGALADAGLTLDDVDLFVCNQSLGWFVDACRRGLGLPSSKTVDTFAEVANIGAAAVPFNLERAHRTGRLRDGDVVLSYAPGAGFTRAAAVYRWVDPARARA